MIFLDYIIDNFLLTYLLEWGAALAGTLYLKKVKNYIKEIRLFVIYLWFVVFVEFVGLYPSVAYFSDYKIFPFVEDTLFERNYWWYNCYNIIKYYIIYRFFTSQFDNDKTRNILYVISLLLIATFIVNFFISGSFWLSYSAYVTIVGSVYLLILILLYHISLLKSNKILAINKSIEFYISIGLLVWHISGTPLFIYNRYFSLENSEFIEFHGFFLEMLNVFLYGIMILGFLVCAKLNREENFLQTEENIKV